MLVTSMEGYRHGVNFIRRQQGGVLDIRNARGGPQVLDHPHERIEVRYDLEAAEHQRVALPEPSGARRQRTAVFRAAHIVAKMGGLTRAEASGTEFACRSLNGPCQRALRCVYNDLHILGILCKHLLGNIASITCIIRISACQGCG